MADNNTELSVLQFHMPSLLQGMEVGQRLKTMIKLSKAITPKKDYLYDGVSTFTMDVPTYTVNATNHTRMEDFFTIGIDKADTSLTEVYLDGELLASTTSSGPQVLRVDDVVESKGMAGKTITLTVKSSGDYALGQPVFGLWYDAADKAANDIDLKIRPKTAILSDNIVELISYASPFNADGLAGEAMGAFEDCTALTDIEISNSVRTIGVRAFYKCTGLSNMQIPTGVISIDEMAFAQSSISSISMPDTLVNIGHRAFYYCKSLLSIAIPNSVCAIKPETFYGCNALSSVTIPDHITAIEEGTFCSCVALSSIHLPNNLVHIGDHSFSSCSLSSIDIPQNVTTIGSNAFAYCDIASITIPGNVVSIGEKAFLQCYDLSNVIILDGVKDIGKDAFRSCTSLSSIVIPKSISRIGAGAFCYCYSLVNVSIDENNEHYCADDLIIYNKDKSMIHSYLASNTRTSFTVPSSVTSIYDNAFENDNNLQSISMTSVTSIGSRAFLTCELTSISIIGTSIELSEYAFYNSTKITTLVIDATITSMGEHVFDNLAKLTNFTVPEGTQYISDSAFKSCSRMTSIVLPNSLTSIGSYAFDECLSLSNIIIPDNVIFIGDSAFNRCSKLSNIDISGHNNAYCFENGVLYNKDKTLLHTYLKYNANTTFTIPVGVGVININAFYNCNNLTSIDIPNSVGIISESAFNNCNYMTSITFRHTVNDSLSIGLKAFYAGITIATTVNHHNNNAVLNYNWAGDYRTATLVELG